MLKQYVEERSVTPLALNYDFALITLSNAAPVGTTYMDIAAGQGTVKLDVTTAGYPADKSGQNMWAVSEVRRVRKMRSAFLPQGRGPCLVPGRLLSQAVCLPAERRGNRW